MIRDVLKNHPIRLCGGVLIGIINGLLVVINIIFLQKILDSGIEGDYLKAFIQLLMLGGSLGLSVLLNWIKRINGIILTQAVSLEEGELLLEKSGKIAYEIYEDGSKYSLISRVMEEGIKQVNDGIQTVFTAAEFASQLIGLIVYMGSIQWWCLLLTVLMTIPIWFLTIVGASGENRFMKSNWKWNQRAKLFSNILVSRKYVKEAKLFRFYPLIANKWKNNAQEYQMGKIRSSLASRVWIGGVNFLQYALTIVMIGIMIPKVRTGMLTIGTLVATMDALWRIIGSGLFTVVGLLGAFVTLGEFTKLRKSFLEYSEEIKQGEEELSEVQNIEFRNVSFAYPYSGEKTESKGMERKKVLNNVSFYIQKGEKVALVGENGSGKSTIIKLLSGLLRPDSGEILINGRNASDYTLSSRRKMFSVVFQDYVRYEMTVLDNVKVGAIWKNGDVAQAMDMIDPLLREEIGSIDQVLGKSSGKGRDISGGQWQKVALARGVYSDGDVLLMDEPTASIDPLAEREVIETMLQVKKHMTKIIVTHRLGAVRKVDKVIVMKNGEVENIGTHEKLRKEDSYYEKLYSTQEQWYLS